MRTPQVTIMSGTAAIWPGEWVSAVDPLLVAILVGLGTLTFVSIVFAVLFFSRNQQRREVREIVVALEDLRAGRGRPRVPTESRSSVAVVADAVNRLSHELGARWRESERAEERLQAFLQATRDQGVIVTDADWEILEFSEGAATLFGWTEAEIRSRSVSTLLEEDTWKELLPRVSRRSLRDLGVDMRGAMVRRDGSSFEAELRVRSHAHSPGESPGFLLVVRDVTAEVELERELRASEVRYRGLVEGLPEPVLIVRDGAVAYANPSMGGILGTSARELEGRPLSEWVATRDLLVLQEALVGVEADAERVEEVRCTLTGTNGAPVASARIRLTGVRHAGGAAVLASVFDETSEARIREELRQSEGRLDAVLESTPLGIVVVADLMQGGVVRVTNRAFLELFGFREEQVLGASEGDLLRLLHARGGGAETVASFVATTAESKRTERIVLSNDPPTTVEVTVAPLVGRSGSLLGKIVACNDLSAQMACRQRLESDAEELRRSKADLEQSYLDLDAVHEDLKQRAKRLEEFNTELQKLEEMRSNLLENVSHELQAPLVAIRGFSEMILKERLGAINEEQRKGLGISLRNIDRMIAMIDGLQDISRLERLELSVFPLSAVIEETLDLLRPGLDEKGVRATVSLDDDEVSVRADRDKILEVFQNLVGNAIKYNREGGSIEIRAFNDRPGYVQVQVRDTGVGIPREEISRIFDRFHRASETGEGKGLGLAITRNILALHGCRIWADSEPGGGATFSFTLPLAEEEGRQPASGAVGGDGPDDAGAPGPRRRGPETSPPKPRLRIIRPPRR